VEQIIDWLGGRFDQNESFSPELLAGSPARVVLTAADPALARFIQRIEITLSAAPGAIASIKIDEGDDAFTRIDFKGVELNGILPKDAFNEPR